MIRITGMQEAVFVLFVVRELRLGPELLELILAAWGVGGLLGGLLGTTLGLRPTLFAGALGVTLSSLWIILSPVRGLRQPPISSGD